jgi:hypothetical protein
MRKSLKFVAAMMVITSATFANQVFASNVNIINTTEVATAKLLAKGSENDFVAFMEKKATKFTKTTEWTNFVTVIRLYNQSPNALLNASPAQRAAFNQAVSVLNEKLGKMKSNEAANWKYSVGFTSATLNFLWNQSNKSDNQVVEEEAFEVTTAVTSM